MRHKTKDENLRRNEGKGRIRKLNLFPEMKLSMYQSSETVIFLFPSIKDCMGPLVQCIDHAVSAAFTHQYSAQLC